MHKLAFPAAVLLLLVVFLLLSAPSAMAEPADVRVVMADIDWNSIDHTHCGFASKQQLLDEVSGYASSIAALTGRDDWTAFYGSDSVTIEIRFTISASHVEGGYQSYAKRTPRIYINRSMAEYDFWPLAHELTHLICPEYSALSLREGLACYIQDEIGQNPAVFNYGLDVHTLARLYLLEDNTDYLALPASPDYDPSIDNTAGEKRAAFYLCSYSFSRYLIKTYGIKSFMELYENSNLSKTCRLVYGCDIDSLVDEWERYLYDYPARMTRVEIGQAMAEIKALHGVPVAP